MAHHNILLTGDAPGGNYRSRLLALLASGELAPPRGRVSRVVVEHAADCAIFEGRPCDCEPSIRLAEVL